jgi:hypothetical protein
VTGVPCSRECVGGITPTAHTHQLGPAPVQFVGDTRDAFYRNYVARQWIRWCLQRRTHKRGAVPHCEQQRVVGKAALPQEGQLDGVHRRIAAIQRFRKPAELVYRAMQYDLHESRMGAKVQGVHRISWRSDSASVRICRILRGVSPADTHARGK